MFVESHLLEHTAKRHKAESFHGELYRFRSAVHALHAYYGLDAFEWPDKICGKV